FRTDSLVTTPPPPCSTLFPYTTLFRSVRRQFQAQGRPTLRRSAVEDSRHAIASDRASRRAAHRRDLPAQRPLRRSRRAQDHRASDRKSTRLNSSHVAISYAVFCLKKKT